MAIKNNQILTIDLSKTGNVDYTASGKTALNLTGVTNLDAFDVTTDGNTLYFKKGAITIATIYAFKGIKYSKLENDMDFTTDLVSGMINYTGEHLIKKGNIAGSNYNDNINKNSYRINDVSSITDSGLNGLTIDSGKGKDTIVGTIYKDTIKGGDGDDEITGGKGDDIITGGIGENTVNYSKGQGNDTIYLTKGENFTLNLTDLDLASLDFQYTNNNKDLEISYQNGFKRETITLKNFGSKDITNNKTKKTDDTSSVYLATTDRNGANKIDLRFAIVNVDGVTTYLYETIVDKKNFTGTWLNDHINARTSEELLDKKGKHVDMALNGGDGNDLIESSNFADNITGGAGGNIIKYSSFEQIDGDRIYLTKGENLSFDMYNLDVYESNFSYKKNGKNLEVTVTKEDNTATFTIMNFAAKDITGGDTQVKIYANSMTLDLRNDIFMDAITTSKKFTGTWLSEEIRGSLTSPTNTKKISGLTLSGGAGNDVIYGTNFNDTLNGGAGNDVLYGEEGNDILKGGDGNDYLLGGKGNDQLYGEAGNNIYQFNDGDGIDTIYSGKGADTIEFLSSGATFDLLTFDRPTNEKGKLTNDLVIHYGLDRDSYITVKDYYKTNKKGELTTSVKNIKIGNTTKTVAEAMNYVSDLPEGTIVNGSGNNFNITSGTKFVLGSSGDDNIDLTPSNEAKVYVLADEGNNTVTGKTSSSTNYHIFAGVGNDNITTGNGADVIDAGDGNNTITTGNGKKQITTGDGNQTITTGSGNDEIVAGDGHHNISAGGGTNTITAGDNTSTTERGIINTSYGTHTITVGDGGYEIYTSGANTITAGDGDNVISKNPENSYSTDKDDITTGSGNDTIYIKGYGEGTIINAGEGNNNIHYDDYGTQSGINYGAAEITTGAGNDTITIGGYNESTGQWVTGTSRNTVDAGDGDNAVTIGHTDTRDNTVTTGSGDDTITTFGYNNTIQAGGGDNEISVSGNQAYGNEITTGSGDDTITLGNGSTNNNEVYWNVINAGDGHNVITTGYGTAKITAGDSTITDTEDEHYNLGSEITVGNESDKTSGYRNTGSEITTGSGDDNITIYGYTVDQAKIDAGDGNNTIILDGQSTNNNEIEAGDGNNTVTIGYTNNSYSTNTITLGNTAEGGQNTVTVGHGISTIKTGNGKAVITVGSSTDVGQGYDQTIETGNGDDNIHVYGYGSNTVIDAGSGNNTITYGDGLTNNYGSGGATITTGAGNDTINIGTVEDNAYNAYSKGAVSGNTVNAGAGDNDIYIASSSSNNITTLDGDDTIYIRGGNNNTIDGGEGDNEVVIGRDKDDTTDYYTSSSNNTVTTGSGDDTIRIISGYSSTIDAGDGNNTITADGNNNTITTGSGVDNITVGDSYNKITIGAYNDQTETVTKEGGKNNTVNLGNGSENEVHIYNTLLEDGKVNTITMGNNSSYNTIEVLNGHTSITGGDNNYGCEITTGAGNDTITLGSCSNTIDAGSGNNDITVGSGDTTITTGAGNDNITLTGSGNSENEINAGDGANTVTSTGSIYSTIIETGSGNDTISIGYGTNNEINAGAGANTITTGGGDYDTITTTGNEEQTITVGNSDHYIGYQSEISTGSGNDEIKVYGYGSDVEITSTGGNNNIQYGLGMDGYGGGSGDYGTITTGNGNDTITVGTFDEDKGESLGTVKSVTVNAGGGANVIKAADDSDWLTVTTTGDSVQRITVGDDSDYVNITTQGGDDTITIAQTEDSYNSNINAGEGNNSITIGGLAGEDEYFYTYRNTITTGSGDDTITIGDNSNTGGYYANTINAGAGHNIISVASAAIITAGDSTVTDTTDENYNIGSEISLGRDNDSNTVESTITTGSGNDKITVTGYSANTTIDAGEGDNTIEFDKDGDHSHSGAKIITGSGDDTITTGVSDRVSIYAGGGDNTVVAKGSSVTIETGNGKDNITLGNSANNLEVDWYGTVNIGHDERDVKDYWDDDLGDYVYRHEDAVEGGLENIVNVNNIQRGEVNIFNSYTDDEKQNTINLNRSYAMEINVTGGHTNIDAGYEEDLYDYVFGSDNEITTGAGNDTITNFNTDNTIDAGDGDNTITMAEIQGNGNDITTGAGSDTITVYGESDISAGAGNDIVNINVVSEEKYHDEGYSRGSYETSIALGAGNDVINIDENYEGYINFIFNYGDGANNVVTGMHEGIGFKVHIDPTCDCIIRPKQGELTSMEVVLIRDGVETGDILTIDNIYNEDGTAFAQYIQDSQWYYYIGESYIVNLPSGIINQNKQLTNVVGTDDNDIIYGSEDGDTITPGYGSDTIRPFGGDDVIDFDGSNHYWSGSKYIHYNIGDGNLTLRNVSQGGYEYLYMEGITDEGTTFEKHGEDLHIVRSNGETAIIENYYCSDNDPDSAGWPNFYDHIYVYEKDGTNFGSLNSYINDYYNPIEVHIYPNENNIIVGSAIGISIMHPDNNTLKIAPYQYNNKETIIYGTNTTGVRTHVDFGWCNSDYTTWERVGDDLIVKVMQDNDFDYRDYDSINDYLENGNYSTFRIVDFFSEYNTVSFFDFSDRHLDAEYVVAEAMTHAVNKTTDSGETLNAPNEQDWWLGNYTFNAGEGNDTINSTGNADIAYGNGGNDTFNTNGEPQSGLFVGGEGANTYNIHTQAYGTHTIVSTSGQDTLNFVDAGTGGYDITNTDAVTLSAQGNDVVISATNYILGSHEFVIKDALTREIDLAITDDASHNTTLRDVMEANNIYVSSADTLGSSTLLGTTNDDYIVGLDDISTIKGGQGSDTIVAYDDATVFTYSGDPINITSVDSFKDVGSDVYPPYHPVDKVYLHGQNNTVYAQSETNYITSYNKDTEYDDVNDEYIQLNSDHYYAYLDQNTTIDDMGGNDTLTLMNTYGTSDGQYMISGLQNTYIVCDVFSYYYRSGYGDDAFDVLIFDNANILRWQNGYDLDEEDSTIAPNYIRIKCNEIENITTSDGYTITSSQLAELAELTANWMSSNDMSTYFDDMRGDNSYSADMNNCLAYVQEQAADMWTHV